MSAGQRSQNVRLNGIGVCDTAEIFVLLFSRFGTNQEKSRLKNAR